MGENSVRLFGSEGMLVYSNGHGYCSDHRKATLTLSRHDGDDLALGCDELNGKATSALDRPDCHGDGATATQSLRTFVQVCRRHDARADDKQESGLFLGADAEVGARTVEAIDAMYRSARSGQLERVWRKQ